MKLLSSHVCRSNFISCILFLVLSFGNQFSLYSQTKTYGLLKKVSGNDENGYVLFSPLNCDTTYLINKCGQSVHQWTSPFAPGMSLYLQPNGHLIKAGTFTDTFFGVAGGKGGIIEEFDWDNQLIWRYKIFNDSLCQHHDIKPLPNGNILVLTWHAISKQKALALGRRSSNFGVNQSDLWGERLIELKPIGKDSAEIVWQWDLFDHIVQEEDTTLPNYGTVIQHPEKVNINYALNLTTNDWIHANGIDYNPDLDQVVISCHNFSEFWIIDHSTTIAQAKSGSGGNQGKGGDLLYRWGNPQAYNAGTSSDRKLFRQHHAYWIPNGMKDSGCIMLFNNGLDRDTAYSSVEVIKTPVQSNGSYQSNLPYLPANPFWKYKDSIPKNFYSSIISGAERMPNGNTLICSGVQGLFFEVTPSGKTVWKYKNPLLGNTVRTDGVNANNAVFRCTFYPSSFPAFKNKNLSSGRVLEKASMTYSCNYEYIAPSVVSLKPSTKSISIKPDTILQIAFNETVLKSIGSINIYSNNVLYESIAVSSDLVIVNNNVMTIRHLKQFPFNSRISIGMASKVIRDSSFNFLIAPLDSSKWNFTIRNSYPKLLTLLPDSGQLNVKTDVLPSMFFDEKISKSSSGNFRIYENGLLKEVIPINSNRISTAGNLVTIQPSVKFGFNAVIGIEVDSCLFNSYGYKNRPIKSNKWVFRTVSRASVVKLIPASQSLDVDDDPQLTIQFDRTLTLDSIKPIKMYENGVLKQQFNTDAAAVTYSGTYLTIQAYNEFKSNARISIEFPAGALVDQNGTSFNGIDSSNWWFKVESNSSVKSAQLKMFKLYPMPVADKFKIESTMAIDKLELMDLNGKVIQLEFIKQDGYYELNLEGLVSGHYMLRINAQYSMKISKT